MTCHSEAVVSADGGGVALLGAPNAGKSSVFNHLTGLRARTANYPGVTVSRTEGVVSDGRTRVTLTDLPGTYGLEPASPDEQVVVDHLNGRLDGAREPGALLLVVDATTLQRSLRLVGQALAAGRPCAVVLTMTDELAARGGTVDAEALALALGVPVHPVVGHRGRGMGPLRASLLDWPAWPTPVVAPPGSGAGLDGWVRSVVERAGFRPARPSSSTRGIDRVLLHPVWGLLAFAVVMTAFFQVIFVVAAPLQGGVEALFGRLGGLATAHLGPPVLADLVGTAVIGGLGGVLAFLPQIALLFLLLALLEGVGYLSRAAVLMDRVMAVSGLDGRAFVAMLSSVACAIPGIMSTRTIPSARDRLATMMAAPLMPCSARLPVYLLLVGMLVPADERFGPLSVQGLTLFALYLLGGLSAMVAALALRATVLRHGGPHFYLELPPYRVPTLRTVAHQVWSPVRTFLRKVGTIILVATLALWALTSFPHQDERTEGMTEARAGAYVLDHSYAASLGRAIEPVFEPLGFDWRVDIGLIGALAAREVFVSTLGQVAAAQDPENPADALRRFVWESGERAGEPVFTGPTTVALLVFFVYALQCVSTLAVLRRESNSWRWPALALVGMGTLAWVMAWLARAVTVALT